MDLFLSEILNFLEDVIPMPPHLIAEILEIRKERQVAEAKIKHLLEMESGIIRLHSADSSFKRNRLEYYSTSDSSGSEQ